MRTPTDCQMMNCFAIVSVKYAQVREVQTDMKWPSREASSSRPVAHSIAVVVVVVAAAVVVVEQRYQPHVEDG